MVVSFQDYQEYLKRRLNYAEKMTDVIFSYDDRIDFTNYLLIKVLEVLGGNISPDINVNVSQPGILKNLPNIRTGSKAIKVAGTPERLPPVFVPDGFEVAIEASSDNVGNIYIGNSEGEVNDVDVRLPRTPGSNVKYKVSTLNNIWVNVDNADDKIFWTVEKP